MAQQNGHFGKKAMMMLNSMEPAERAVLFALSHGAGGASGGFGTLQQHLEACIKFCISVILVNKW